MNKTLPDDGLVNWLFLDLNSFFASCEQQQRPELRGQPVAIVQMMTDSTCAIAASYEAKAFGVKTGTAIWEAKPSDQISRFTGHAAFQRVPEEWEF